MHTGHYRPRAWLLLPLLLALCATLVRCGEPEVTLNRFHNLPARLFYFDDTTEVVYHDVIEGSLYVSSDEGKSWTKPDLPDGGQGKVSQVIPHPFQRQMAFALSHDKTHWKTDDRGKTWRMFELPIPPAWSAEPLSFHSQPAMRNYILYQGTKCDRKGWGQVCHDETYYTKEAFSDKAELLLSDTSKCQFAHSRAEFKHDAPRDLIYCIAFDQSTTDGSHSIASSRLFSSTDYFQKENRVEDFGIGKDARGVIALAVISKFAVAALKDLSPGNNGEMLLYTTTDATRWSKAHFPHATSAKLKENSYTVVEGTTHSLGVDVVLSGSVDANIGTLFVSDSAGAEFTESLADTNRNDAGYVDFETVYGVDGVGIANIVGNAREVEGRRVQKRLQSRITFDDGRTWDYLRAPSADDKGVKFSCDTSKPEKCSLHVHSVTVPHNFGRVFSSPAPGFVMAVGSVGEFLKPYSECDTFLSTDAGLTWSMVHKDAHIYEFGDQGTIMVMINDEEGTDHVLYSMDLGQTWTTLKLPLSIRARALLTIPDATSQKFTLVGQLSRKDKDKDGGYAVIYLDFAPKRSRQCGDDDFEQWMARPSKGAECLMGHKQVYKRRKAKADCYIGHKFDDPKAENENCRCEDSDYECDFNFVRDGDKCIPMGPEPIPAGVCTSPDDTYKGSSGYRLIPGNTCNYKDGVKKDEKVEKKCSQAAPPEGEIRHQTFKFSAPIEQQQFFRKSSTILVRLHNREVWQSSNEGYTWRQVEPERKFIGFLMHTYSDDRAYLLTDTRDFFVTTDGGKSWHPRKAELQPNMLSPDVLFFHPERSDNLIWIGAKDCSSGNSCHLEASYSTDNGRNWHFIERYVRVCEWARDSELKVDATQILCESYKEKKGNQRFMSAATHHMSLVSGKQYYKNKRTVFDRVVGFAKFSEYLVVAEMQEQHRSLDLQVSLDGSHFAEGQFPSNMRPDQHSYTILESSTKALFLHVTTSEVRNFHWGNILKSNSNGTYFGLSAEYVNRDERGYVDFEKLIGIDGIALINVVANPNEALLSGKKTIHSKISHNDGGSWNLLKPPMQDSLGSKYKCDSTDCNLHIHGYTERSDPRATYSTPSVPGLLMAVGNVGKTLAPYHDSDTFISRDAGFTWEEVHKDAHMWEFGDSGSILVAANDEEPTDHLIYTTDQGLKWNEYKFSDEKMRLRSIVTVPSDTSRKFILIAENARGEDSIAVQVDFTSVTSMQCRLDENNPKDDDFEWWSPAEHRAEKCLFGRRVLYQRRKRDSHCFVGDRRLDTKKEIDACTCDEHDFECAFNYQRDPATNKCELVENEKSLEDDPDDQCRNGAEFWYERTAYQKVEHSSCEGGDRPDRGEAHRCPGFGAHSALFWWTVALVPFAAAGAAGWWYSNARGAGAIRLPGDGSRARGSDVFETLASVPWFIVGIAGVAWEWVASRLQSNSGGGWGGSRSGYRRMPMDADAQPLRFEDDEP